MSVSELPNNLQNRYILGAASQHESSPSRRRELYVFCRITSFYFYEGMTSCGLACLSIQDRSSYGRNT